MSQEEQKNLSANVNKETTYSSEDFAKAVKTMAAVWQKLAIGLQEFSSALTQSFRSLLPYLLVQKKYKRVCWLAEHGKNARIRKKNKKKLDEALNKLKEEYHDYNKRTK